MNFFKNFNWNNSKAVFTFAILGAIMSYFITRSFNGYISSFCSVLIILFWISWVNSKSISLIETIISISGGFLSLITWRILQNDIIPFKYELFDIVNNESGTYIYLGEGYFHFPVFVIVFLWILIGGFFINLSLKPKK